MLRRVTIATKFQKSQIFHGPHLDGCSSFRYVGLCNKGEWLHDALKSAEIMHEQGLPISEDLAYNLIHECTHQQDLERSKRVQFLMVENALDSSLPLADHLIRLFASCGSLSDANSAFGKVSNPSQYTWNAIIGAHTKLGKDAMALHLYRRMHHEGIKPDKFTFLSIIKACSSTGDIEQGRHVHQEMVDSEFEPDVVMENTILDMYAKCGYLGEAGAVFDSISNKSVVTWNAIISGYAQHGKGAIALEYFKQMQKEGQKPDKVTFLSILKACSNIGDVEEGKQIHKQITESELRSDIVLGNSVVDMYAKCGYLEDARNVFELLQDRDVVTWNTMIAGYAQHDKGYAALEFFKRMHQEAVKPDKVTYLSILKACGNISAIEQGRHIHRQIVGCGMCSDIAVQNTLVGMYSKCGRFEEANEIFDRMPSRNVVTWSAMIEGYAQHGEGLLALKCFERMQRAGIQPCKVTFLSTLKACSSIGAIKEGRNIHKYIVESGLELDIVVGSTLVDMYAKCGSLEEAHKVFDRLPKRNTVTWNAMIVGYAQCGDAESARQCLEEMQSQGIKPNEVTFATLLAACGHAGLLDVGCTYFKLMIEGHCITPDAHHYACIVDLLGRTGRLKEAETLLETIHPDVIVLRTLLAACKTYGNIEIGRQCFDQIVQLDPQHGGAYMLMTGTYSDASMWKEAVKIEELRQHACAWKKPAKAWIEVNSKVHEFIVGDKSHPHYEGICRRLKSLNDRMKEAGYVPKVDMVLQQISDEEKEDALCGHCEKLAIVFGLMSTSPGSVIRATKNLRVCIDCHNAVKAISKVERREIIIRDAYRVHHFADGSCSCKDYQ